MVIGFALIFMALVAGYCLHFKNTQVQKSIDMLVNGLVYFILFGIGVSLGLHDGIFAKLDDLFFQLFVLVVSVGSCNVICLLLVTKRFQVPQEKLQTSAQADFSHLRGVILSIVLILCILSTSFLLGYWVRPNKEWIDNFNLVVLYLFLFCIGLQLRYNNIPIKALLLNKLGLFTALVVIGSSLIGGLLAAFLLNWPWAQGMALASGFGWYSLSGILVGSALGPMMASISLLAEVIRELLAFLLIPLVMYKKPFVGIGYGGATTLDFTLPLIQRYGGIQYVPIAIANGFILTLAMPVLMGFFLAL